jgi:uncharacterized protein (TIGR00375 family)
MRIIADLHLHSKYSRATSKDLDLEHVAQWCKWKGITVVGTGDITHPIWTTELKGKLKPTDTGLFEYQGVHFMLTGEINQIYSQGGRGRRIHNVLHVPSFEILDKLNSKLAMYGNLSADGRPILSINCIDLVKLCKDISPDIHIIPAHAWTPWYSIFGSFSGFDSIDECFGDQVKYIHAIETGLSSDPPMNWRWSALDRFVMVSNSDAHSPSKLGRESNVFDTELSYHAIFDAIQKKDRMKFLYTIEFYPEEGKYHYDGHRLCKKRFTPQEAIALNNICPVCNRQMTTGVLHRVEKLADRQDGFRPKSAIPYRNLVPLQEIIAEAFEQKPKTVAVEKEYHRLVKEYENEFNILLDLSESDMKTMNPRIREGIFKVRTGELTIKPGYDGEYGKISIFPKESETSTPQLGLF